MHMVEPLRGDDSRHPAVVCPDDPDDESARARNRPGDPHPGSSPIAEHVLPTVGRLVMEVLAGRRPLAQVAPLLSPAVTARLAARLRAQYRTTDVPSDHVRVRHAATCWIGPAACEGVVTIEHTDRTTALAIRMEQHEERWRIVEVAGPEFEWAPIGPTRRRDMADRDEGGQSLADVVIGPWPAVAEAS